MEESQSCPPLGDDSSLEIEETLRALRSDADQTLHDYRESIAHVEQQLSQQLEQIADELANERLLGQQARETTAEQQSNLNRLQEAVAEKESEVAQLLDQLSEQSHQYEKQLEERDDELAQLLELAEEENQQRDSLELELQQAREALEQVDTQGSTDRETTLAALATAEQELGDSREECESLQNQQQTLEAELDEARQALQAAKVQIEQDQDSLAESRRELDELSQNQQNDEQLEQIRRKFELALADVHKLKRENAELHEELASRPEANDQESPELISLRAERDALATRIEELETASMQVVTADGQQELDDLQRRFELAVDDVRQLKQENADLAEQLARAAQSPGSAVVINDEPLDWQAQKARLLATLDAEDQGALSEEQREERATIEGTISITDSIVAEKDELLHKQQQELEELKIQLEERPVEENTEGLRQQLIEEIVGDDMLVQIEQARLREQQQELQDKLREAELEISVQRATLAREQSALEEKLMSLSQGEGAEELGDDSSGKPRRRWLSALGIKDEDES